MSFPLARRRLHPRSRQHTVKGLHSITALNLSEITRRRRSMTQQRPFESINQTEVILQRLLLPPQSEQGVLLEGKNCHYLQPSAPPTKIFISPRLGQRCWRDYRHKLHFYVLLKRAGQGGTCYFRKSYSATFTAYLGFLPSSAS